MTVSWNGERHAEKKASQSSDDGGKQFAADSLPLCHIISKATGVKMSKKKKKSCSVMAFSSYLQVVHCVIVV